MFYCMVERWTRFGMYGEFERFGVMDVCLLRYVIFLYGRCWVVACFVQGRLV